MVPAKGGVLVASALACFACGSARGLGPDQPLSTDGGERVDAAAVDGSAVAAGDAAGSLLDSAEPSLFPFATTFEDGSLVGARGANVMGAMSLATGGLALFGSYSALASDDGSASTVKRSFAPQPDAFFSFYVKVAAGAGGVLMRLDGAAGPLVEIVANDGGSSSIDYVARIADRLLPLGSAPQGGLERFGVKCTSGATGGARVAVYRGTGAPAVLEPVDAATGVFLEGGAPTGITLGNLDGPRAVGIVVDEVRGTLGGFAPPSM